MMCKYLVLTLIHVIFVSSGHIFHTSVEHVSPSSIKKVYDVKWFNQTLDHFTFTTNMKFRQKYLVNDTYWNRCVKLLLFYKYLFKLCFCSNGGPIFFYTGNEGNIESFAENTGFMWDIAPEFGAMLVFAEHRYYGESLPFPKDGKSKDPSKVGYLSSSQALADYVDLITFIRNTVEGAKVWRLLNISDSFNIC